ncbi:MULTISPECIES: DNA-3-methyladenine glycosylase [unclassified Streptomyces]|uniref:DNA-3-methyladenine glycosylase n=1 Tax=unclassified Streptomyces TaxID=2593676 RepID=UPI0035E079C5
MNKGMDRTLRLTEADAYAGEADPGSDPVRGRAAHGGVMSGAHGHAYVAFMYCLARRSA